MTTIEKINLITQKAQLLLDKQQELTIRDQELTANLEQEKTLAKQLQEENAMLKSTLQTVQQELQRRSTVEAELKQKVSELEAQVEMHRNATGSMDEATRKSMEKQINHYIKEIDRCIALLSQ